MSAVDGGVNTDLLETMRGLSESLRQFKAGIDVIRDIVGIPGAYSDDTATKARALLPRHPPGSDLENALAFLGHRSDDGALTVWSPEAYAETAHMLADLLVEARGQGVRLPIQLPRPPTPPPGVRGKCARGCECSGCRRERDGK